MTRSLSCTVSEIFNVE